MKRAEIKANREKCIAFLQEPELEKFTGGLENPTNNNSRCCLGHMCHVMKLDRWQKPGIDGDIIYGANDSLGFAPSTLQSLIGLKDRHGSFSNYLNDPHNTYKERTSLMALNDDTEMTTQEIGKWLEDKIEGGEGSPFISLAEYPE